MKIYKYTVTEAKTNNCKKKADMLRSELYPGGLQDYIGTLPPNKSG
jgi:hypothetical protein